LTAGQISPTGEGRERSKKGEKKERMVDNNKSRNIKTSHPPADIAPNSL
jgi:hypothetical protein